MPVCSQALLVNTPSPESKMNHLSITTPKGASRKMFSSPAFLRKHYTNLDELSMSPLQLNDTPQRRNIAPITPSTSSRSVNESPRKSPRFLKQTSTPGDDLIPETPSNKNQAFVIESSTSVFSKAKRRLIDDATPSPRNGQRKSLAVIHSPVVQGNVAKKIKIAPKPVKRLRSTQQKRRYGSINAGVGHGIRRPKPKKNSAVQNKVPTVSQLMLSMSPKETDKTTSKEMPLNEKSDCAPGPVESALVKTKEEASQIKIQEIQPVKVPVKNNSSLNDSFTKAEKKLEIIPKVITRNWNNGYREPKERRFFKSRATPEQTQNRVVTVSVNDNLKLQIHEQPVRRSPRKTKWAQEPIVEKSPAKVCEPNSVDLLQQDWDDAGDTMDLSTNIQEILDGLSKDEATDGPGWSTQTPEPDETKENKLEQSSTSKLFPVFLRDATKKVNPTPRVSNKSPNLKSQWIKARNDGENQMILDAGQKVYGAVQCPECRLVYHAKEPEDELLHAKIHNSFKDALKFPGWKKERIVRRHEGDTYIIVIHPSDAAHCWNKVNSILSTVVDKELGFPDIGIRKPDSTKVYLYITDKKVMGVLVAESIPHGFRMLSNTATTQGKCCSTDPVAVVCGISRIWTLASYRRHKVATRLLDAMRSEFVYGKYIGLDEIAFSDPTENGLSFAQFYTKRTDFLVYNM